MYVQEGRQQAPHARLLLRLDAEVGQRGRDNAKVSSIVDPLDGAAAALRKIFVMAGILQACRRARRAVHAGQHLSAKQQASEYSDTHAEI